MSAGNGIAELVQEYEESRNKLGEDGGMEEDLLQRLLSELASLSSPPRIVANQIESFLDHSSKILMGQPAAGNKDAVQDNWEQGICLASRLAKKLSGTELHSAASSCIVFGQSSAFTTCCLLLCCRALRECPALIEKRWKRWQSILLETVRLFQQFGMKLQNPELTTRLWCQYVSPALAHLQTALLSGSLPSDPPPRWMAYEAGTVCCVARLATIAHAMPNSLLRQQLLESLDRDVLHGRYDLLYEHPWRQFEPPNQTLQTESFALAFYATNQRLSSEEDEADRHEQFLGMDTVWSPLGVGIVVATTGWENRPNVWSSQHTWHVFFPHVDALLLGFHQERKEEEGDTEDESLGSYSSNTRFASLGFHLLRNLLQTTPDGSLSAPQNFSNAPDSPIGACQLISNQIIVSSSQELSSNHGDEQHTTLPSAARSFQMLKQLVAKYDPTYQVQLVRQLYNDCPHAGLRAKLLDLLRSFVSWDNNKAEKHIWHFLETEFLIKLENHASDIDNSLQELVHKAEVYSAALGLFQLWLLCKKNDPIGVDNLRSRLASIYRGLERFGTSDRIDDKAEHLPAQYFRLHLLESALRQTLDLLS